MPNSDNLIDMIMIAEHVEQGPGETFLTTLDMTYSHGQVEQIEEKTRHCNFQIIGGKAIGISRIITGFSGFTTMPTKFQRIMDLTLAVITKTFAFIDDNLIVTLTGQKKNMKKVHKQEDTKKVQKVLTRLDEANINL